MINDAFFFRFFSLLPLPERLLGVLVDLRQLALVLLVVAAVCGLCRLLGFLLLPELGLLLLGLLLLALADGD